MFRHWDSRALWLIVLAFTQPVIAQDTGVAPITPEQYFAGMMAAKGSYDTTDLCANVQQDCKVGDNRITLGYSLDTETVAGRSVSIISYKPYPQCATWLLSTAFSDFSGQLTTPSRMGGTAKGTASLLAEIWVAGSKKCQPHARTFVLDAIWEAQIDGDRATGVLTVQGAQGHNTAGFTLDLAPMLEVIADPCACAPDNDTCGTIREIQRRDSEELSMVCGSRG